VTPTARPVQRRRLIRARDLSSFRQTLVDLAIAGRPLDARRRAMILPTRASIELLRQTIETAARRSGRVAVILPHMLTRDDWMARLHDALPSAPRLLSRFEREVLLARAAAGAARRARMPGHPFELRPGLVAEMLNLYDEIRRRQRSVGRFTRALFDELRVERGTDRGSEGLIHQTCFLGFAFLGYERGVASSGGIDEHELRRQLIARDPALPCDHLVVAVADHPSDPRGLWPADFDLVGRLGGFREIEVVVTEEAHDAGFRDRIDRELPGIEEVTRESDRRLPVLVGPAIGGNDAPCFVSRDREEELRDVARAIRRRAETTGHELREPTAIVFHRPLPYLYVARQVLTEARVPFQAFDALPLGSEPYAALLDLVVTAARTGGTRDASVALLRSPFLAFEVGGAPIELQDAAALHVVLTERRATGEADTYPNEVASYFGARETRDRIEAVRATRAARAAAAIREALQPYRMGASASAQMQTVAAFLRRFERSTAGDGPPGERDRRARAAVLGVLDGLTEAFRRHDDLARPHDALTAVLHHAIEGQMFSPARGPGGVLLLDAVAARFGDFDHVHLVGLVETDWPERPRKSVFYTSGLLTSLGWPQAQDQGRAEQAAFRDLLRLPAQTLQLHAFQLEGDSLVALSPLVEEARTLASREPDAAPRRLIFPDEVLTVESPLAGALDAESATWLALRQRRPSLRTREYAGQVEPQPPQAYRVSRVDRYVDCPFKYFSESVLGLPEDREDASGLTPLERGTLVHVLFERFYRTWQADRRGTITPENLPAALALFGQLTREALSHVPPGDRALEETRLLGSIVARGVAERVFELEADAGGRVVDRLVEFDLRGPFVFPRLGGLTHSTIEIRGKADRIDVFDDGALRVIDYKLGKLPDVESSLQIAVYAHCVRQALEVGDGRPHPVTAAAYLAFGDERKLEAKLGRPGEPAAMAVEQRASEFAATIARIEAGQFPAQPKRPSDCQWCRYAGVCRKEYLAEDDAAEPV
jgi:RecB family exonuclease